MGLKPKTVFPILILVLNSGKNVLILILGFSGTFSKPVLNTGFKPNFIIHLYTLICFENNKLFQTQ